MDCLLIIVLQGRIRPEDSQYTNPAWRDLPLPTLAELETARTIIFRPRVALPPGAKPPVTLREGSTWVVPDS